MLDKDLRLEHWAHQRHYTNCSECFKENKFRLARLAKLRERIGRDNHSLLNPLNGDSPWDKNPLE